MARLVEFVLALFRSLLASFRGRDPRPLPAPEPPVPPVVLPSDIRMPAPKVDTSVASPVVQGHVVVTWLPSVDQPPPTDVWPEVRRRFQAFSGAREGRKNMMYLDTHKPRAIVTFGTGNALFSWKQAAEWPWKRPDGSLASEAEIQAAWEAVDARQDLAGKPFSVWAGVTDLRLDESVLDRVFWKAFDDAIGGLVKNWPAFFSWPAAAQFALLSWAWGHGTDPKDYPKMNAALKARDFARAADEIAFDETKTRGVHERNVANRALLLEAVEVEKTGGDPSIIRTKV